MGVKYTEKMKMPQWEEKHSNIRLWRTGSKQQQNNSNQERQLTFILGEQRQHQQAIQDQVKGNSGPSVRGKTSGRKMMQRGFHHTLTQCWGSGSVCFGTPGSGFGSISQRYGSGSFYHQAKRVRKTMIPTVLLLLYDFLSLKMK